MQQDKDNERYFPSEEEHRVLIAKLKEYFTYQERSNDRKNVVNVTYDLLKDNYNHWNPSNIRLWFNNNKTTYIGKDPVRIPTPRITPIKPVDPNLPQLPLPPDPMPIIITAPEPIPNIEPPKPTFLNKPEYIEDPFLNNAPDFPDIPPPQVKFNHMEANEITISIDEPKSDDLPEIPTNIEEIDQYKYHCYDALKSLYRNIKISGQNDPEDRLNEQIKIEERFGQCIDALRKITDEVYSPDPVAKHIEAQLTKQIQRQVSTTTATFASEGRIPSSSRKTIDLEQTSPNVFFAKNQEALLRRVQNNETLYAIYHGDCQQTKNDVNGILCSTVNNRGDIFYIYFNKMQRCYMIAHGDVEAPTGFFKEATSMMFDYTNNLVWAAGDCRVKAYKPDTLACVDTLNAGANWISSSSIASWQGQIVMGSDKLIAVWQSKPMANPKVTMIKNKNNEEVAKANGLDLDKIEWTGGRRTNVTFAPSNQVSHISTICPVGNYLAIGSYDHHAIHLMNNEGNTVGRLIGHTAGITCLLSTDEKTLYSGSLDKTVKRWDVEKMYSTLHLIRHGGPITCLTAGVIDDHTFLFSGGKDNCIRGWDVTNLSALFEARSGTQTPISVHFIPSLRELVFVTKENTEQVAMSTPGINDQNVINEYVFFGTKK